MIRTVLIAFSAISLFSFPWILSAIIIFAASLFVPVAALAFGLMYDALYWVPGIGLPLATLAGLVASVAAFFIRRFIQTRITEFSL